jgi:hypothetical protein
MFMTSQWAQEYDAISHGVMTDYFCLDRIKGAAQPQFDT